jgi:hypothetical protein
LRVADIVCMALQGEKISNSRLSVLWLMADLARNWVIMANHHFCCYKSSIYRIPSFDMAKPDLTTRLFQMYQMHFHIRIVVWKMKKWFQIIPEISKTAFIHHYNHIA